MAINLHRLILFSILLLTIVGGVGCSAAPVPTEPCPECPTCPECELCAKCPSSDEICPNCDFRDVGCVGVDEVNELVNVTNGLINFFNNVTGRNISQMNYYTNFAEGGP